MKIVADSSVWIEYINDLQTPQTAALERLIDAGRVIVGDVIVTEVLRGFRHDRDYYQARSVFLAHGITPMLGPDQAITAAEHYRALRHRGITVKKFGDLIIATYCITHSLPLLYSDQDFDPFVTHLGLTRW